MNSPTRRKIRREDCWITGAANITQGRLQHIVDDIRTQGGDAIGVVTDVTDVSAIERVADVAQDRFGDIALGINDAAIEMIGYSWDIDDANCDRTIDINLHGVIYGTRVFSPSANAFTWK